MMLQQKNAIIYGAGGSMGGAVATALAKAGANVFLTGRDINKLKIVAEKITAAGGSARMAQVDAMDEGTVNRHIETVVQTAGSVDISFNAIALNDVQNIPLVQMAKDDFIRPVNIAAQSHFLTATAAGRVMMKQRSGVILSLTATPAGVAYPLTGGFGTACAVIENLSRLLAAELGPYGVRAVGIRSGGSPDSKVFKDAIAAEPEAMETVLSKMKDDTMLKELPLMADITNVAVFLCSDMAAKITGVIIDLTCGTTSGLNYRAVPIPFV